MIIDCNSCSARTIACGDCVVSFLLETPPASLEAQEVGALSVLAEKGLVPPLRFTS